MMSTVRTDKVIVENSRRMKEYFRKYDAVIGDPLGQTVPRDSIVLDGVK